MLTRLRVRDDEGVAMLTVIMVLGVIVALGVAAVTVSASNLKNAGRDRFATTAQGAAEAAIAAAESYLQTVSASALSCSTSTTVCSSNAWGNSSAPKSLTFPGGRSALVWIELKQAYNPPTYKSSDYVIHAVGKSSTVIGVRTLDQEVSVAPLDFPFGIYVDSKINDTGSAAVTNESVFSRSCVDSRGKLNIGGIDPYYNQPAAVHSASYITNTNQSTCQDPTWEQTHDSNAEHYDTTPGDATHNYCAPTTTGAGSPMDTRYDQDSLGGLFSQDPTDGTTCSSAPNQYSTMTSYFDNNQLTSQYNFTQKGLTDSEYAMLASVAKAQGFYYTSTSSITWPQASAIPNAVVYFDLPAGGNNTVNLSSDINSYAWVDEVPAGTCNTQHPSIIVVVRNGDLSIGSGMSSTGAFFVPEGQISTSGTINIVGTIFANQAKIAGNANIMLNSCYIKNIPGPITSVTPLRFHEKDS
jgi:hypothetical protein